MFYFRHDDLLIVSEGSYGISIWDVADVQKPQKLTSKLF